jgi:hypothetical protein
VVYDSDDTTPDPVLDPFNVDQPWLGNQKQEVVLVIAEVPRPDLDANWAKPTPGVVSVNYDLDNADVTDAFDVELFLASDGATIDDVGNALASVNYEEGLPIGDDYNDTFQVGTSVPEGAALVVWVDSSEVSSEGNVDEYDEDNNDIILPQIDVEDDSADEEDGTITYTVSLASASNRDVTIEWELQQDTGGEHPATEDEDYSAASGTLTIGAGETSGDLTIDLLDDDVYEFDETFELHFFEPKNAYFRDDSGYVTDEETVQFAITDETDKPTITIDDVSGEEGVDSSLTFTIELSNPTLQEVTVDYVTADDTATDGEDYTGLASTQTATFNDGVTTTETVEIRLFAELGL